MHARCAYLRLKNDKKIQHIKIEGKNHSQKTKKKVNAICKWQIEIQNSRVHFFFQKQLAKLNAPIQNVCFFFIFQDSQQKHNKNLDHFSFYLCICQ